MIKTLSPHHSDACSWLSYGLGNDVVLSTSVLNIVIPPSCDGTLLSSYNTLVTTSSYNVSNTNQSGERRGSTGCYVLNLVSWREIEICSSTSTNKKTTENGQASLRCDMTAVHLTSDWGSWEYDDDGVDNYKVNGSPQNDTEIPCKRFYLFFF